MERQKSLGQRSFTGQNFNKQNSNRNHKSFSSSGNFNVGVNSNLNIIKNLQLENERLKKMIVSYEIKYEKYSNEEKKLKLQVQQKEKENKYLNHQITKLSNKEITESISSSSKKESEPGKLKKLVRSQNHSCSSGNTPKKNKTTSSKYLTTTTRKLGCSFISQKTTRTSASRMRKRPLEQSKSITSNNEKRCERSLIVNRRYQNFLEQFEANTLKIVNLEKNKKFQKTSMEKKRIEKKKFGSSSKTISNTSQNHTLNKNHSNNNNPGSKQNVVINNFNCINVYTNGVDSRIDVKRKQRITSSTGNKNDLKKK